MSRLVYCGLWCLIWPFLWLRILRRARQEPLYGKFPLERFAWCLGKGIGPTPLWIHAVSLGETRAVAPLVNRLLAQGHTILLTTTTATGRSEGARLFASAIEQGQLLQVWMPYDSYFVLRRFFRHFSPRLVVLMETEVWPELIHQANHFGVPVVLVSARLSERSCRRVKAVGSLLLEAYQKLSAIFVQTPTDAARFRSLGCQNVTVMGNLKFDFSIDPHDLALGLAWREHLQRSVLCIASTREGEDELFIEALAELAPHYPDVLVLYIPRHPQRFERVIKLLSQANLSVVARSGLIWGGPVSADVQCIVGDSVGEMPKYYGLTDVAIVAGSFLPLGGQNHIEAAVCRVPIIFGPHTFNFAEAAEQALALGAALRSDTPKNALKMAYTLLRDEPRRLQQQLACDRFTAQSQGAVDRCVLSLQPYLS